VAPIPLRFRSRPADFIVDELDTFGGDAAQVDGDDGDRHQGDHLYLRVEKRELSTWDAIGMLARGLGRKARDIGCAGLKDKDGVTRQTFSVEHVSKDDVEALELPGLRILSIRRARKKLKRGKLLGNRFDLKLRDVPDDRLDDVRGVVADLRTRGLPNFFGTQRFGARGDNAATGFDVLRGDLQPPRDANRTKVRFLVSALQSFVFNEVLAARLASLDQMIVGETVLDHRDLRFRRALEGDEAYVRDLSMSPTGPLPGTGDDIRWKGTHPAEVEVLERHAAVVQALTQPGRFSWQGARRALRVPVTDASVDVGGDELGPFVRLCFTLPPGSYATVLIDELAKGTTT